MQLRHPNVMSEAERLALPDPCRPIDCPVVPATYDLQHWLGMTQDKSMSQLWVSPLAMINLNDFIQQQQQYSHSQASASQFFLPLSWLPKLVEAVNNAEWQRLINRHLSDSEYEQRLLLAKQPYHMMLCVLLLCQCKSRKTLNSHITLQDLTEAINQYATAHATELEFFSHQPNLVIEPSHVVIAIAIIGWQTSKHDTFNQRTTVISSQNPLTGR